MNVSILADSVESLIGALYLDGDPEMQENLLSLHGVHILY